MHEYDVKWRKWIKTSQINVFWCVFQPFFSHKTSNFTEFEQKWPGLTYFQTVLHPHLLKCFNAVFARIRGIYLRMIMPSEFLLLRAVFLWRKKNLGGGPFDPPLGTSRVKGPKYAKISNFFLKLENVSSNNTKKAYNSSVRHQNIIIDYYMDLYY